MKKITAFIILFVIVILGGCNMHTKTKITVPSYWEDEINTSIESFEKIAREHDTSDFLYITDTHWNTNAKRSPELINALYDTLDLSFVMFSGDIITGYHESKSEAKEEIQDFYASFDEDIKFITTLGNHDLNRQKNPDSMTYLGASDYEPYEPVSLTDTPYIWDDQDKHVRFINFYYDVVNPDSVNEYTLDSIEQSIEKLSSEWSVVLFSHGYWVPTHPEDGEPAPTNTSLEVRDRLLEIDENTDANIALWMVGHVHQDLSEEVISSNNNAGFTIVSVNCDTCNQSTPWGGLDMKEETDTEQAFELVQIAPKERKIYLTRVGAGDDREFSY